MISGLKSYIKAFSLIYLITFAELWFGFTVMRQKNGFILALLIAAVDMLPVFGVGVVLLPWGLAALTLGNTRKFMYLVILYILITVVRQFAEPKIIGKSIGLNPLVTLFSVFSGYKLFGVLGMIITPIAVAALFSGKVKNADERKDKSKDLPKG